MKGIMFTAKGVTEIIDEPRPECGEDEVLLKTLFSGVSNGDGAEFPDRRPLRQPEVAQPHRLPQHL